MTHLTEFGTPPNGYVSYGNILSGYEEIRFLVPAHEWNELSESEEWKAFQSLLEARQEEYARKLQKEAERQRESLNCKEISYQQPLSHSYVNIAQRILDIFGGLFRRHL